MDVPQQPILLKIVTSKTLTGSSFVIEYSSLYCHCTGEYSEIEELCCHVVNVAFKVGLEGNRVILLIPI